MRISGLDSVIQRFHHPAVVVLAAALTAVQTLAEVPALLHHQGRVLVGGLVSDGPAGFKFALVSAGGGEVYWSNTADVSPADGEPDAGVTLQLNRGLYSVLLGDETLPHMAAIPPAVFDHSEMYLRVWFDPDGGGFVQLTPDQRVAAVGYALMAESVSDGAITAGKLAADALGSLPSDLSDLQTLVAEQAEQIAALQDQVATLTGDSGLVPGLVGASADGADAGLLGLGFERFGSLSAPGWVNASADGAPSARSGHTAVWAADVMIVWGGEISSGLPVASGAWYAPEADEWTPVSTIDPPAARSGHSAIWTGEVRIVWGGTSGGAFLDSGGSLSLHPQKWSPLPVGPAGRTGQVAVWTGDRVLVWGGRDLDGLLADGAAYDPEAGDWTVLTTEGSPPGARWGAVGVWADDRFLIWGGEGAGGPVGDGAVLLFDGSGQPDHWETLSKAGAPAARSGHSAVWAGGCLLVWGGRGAGGVLLGNGAAYDPATDVWEALPEEGAPSARTGHLALWTGTDMLVVSGETSAGVTPDGAAYNPAIGGWWSLSREGGPLPRTRATGIYTGTELALFGGTNASGQPVGALQRLVPQPIWYLYRKP
ncbi:MAG: hypothetical protein KDM81_01500 [Verrucomicrobiae bacterium]|nr:hypothetical protein [Verrucomicrobiae bacterium]